MILFFCAAAVAFYASFIIRAKPVYTNSQKIADDVQRHFLQFNNGGRHCALSSYETLAQNSFSERPKCVKNKPKLCPNLTL